MLVQGGDPACPLLEGRRYETDTPLPPAPVGSRGEGTLGILNYGLERQRYTTTSLHVEIILDPATGQATGSLSVEIFSQEYKDQSVNNPVWSPEYLFTFTGTTETPGTFDGTDGGITFTGIEVQMVGWSGDQVRRESPRSLGFRLALDDQGRLALCSTGSFSIEPAARRQECLDYAYAVLEPVDGGLTPPPPPIT